MSATNRTPNYNLPQFVGTDIPTWLGDINSAMSAIDTAIKGAKDTGETAAADAASVASDLATTNSNLNAATVNISNLQGTVSQNTSAIAAQSALNGSGTLDTIDKTLIGAINELNGRTPDLLWTNPAPTSNFPGQTLTMDLSSYSLILVVYQVSTGTGLQYKKSMLMDKDQSYVFEGFNYSNTTYSIYYRIVTASNTGLVVGPGHIAGGAEANPVCIPYKIYGIK